jgi:uncharacterized membrane protein YqjE
MNMHTETATERGLPRLILSMIGTRLELAAMDVETHAQATLNVALTAFVAVILGLFAIAFLGVAMIVFFWDTHRIAAAVAVTLGYAIVAALVAWRAHAVWRSRPAAFAGILHELELDGEAVGRRP